MLTANCEPEPSCYSVADGRVPNLGAQALQPPINPNEMANTPEGPYPPAIGGYSPLLVQKLAKLEAVTKVVTNACSLRDIDPSGVQTAKRSTVIKYIQNQQEHHRCKSFSEEYVELLNRLNVLHDQRYIFQPVDPD